MYKLIMLLKRKARALYPCKKQLANFIGILFDDAIRKLNLFRFLIIDHSCSKCLVEDYLTAIGSK